MDSIQPRRVLVLAERGGLHEGFTATGLQWLDEQKERLNLELTVLETAEEIPQGEIGKYRLVLQLNHPPYAWSEAAQRDMEEYIDSGRGGFIGFHHATLLGEFDGYPMWEWFSDFMGKIRYKNYIADKTDGTVQVEDREHPVMKDVPGTFVIPDDEWYTYETNPRPNVHVLAHVDRRRRHATSISSSATAGCCSKTRPSSPSSRMPSAGRWATRIRLLPRRRNMLPTMPVLPASRRWSTTSPMPRRRMCSSTSRPSSSSTSSPTARAG